MVTKCICPSGVPALPGASCTYPVVYDYYTRKCSGKKKTVAMGAVMHKICNIIFAMLPDNKPFEVITPEEHCRRFAAEHPEKAGKAA